MGSAQECGMKRECGLHLPINSAPAFNTPNLKVVAREGSAPSIPGCRPGVILFHHRAKLAAGAGFAPTWPPSKGGVLLIRRPGKKVVEPEVVATSPYPIKSRVPVCCGFSSRKIAGRERPCTSKAHRFSICRVCYSLLTARPRKTGAPSRHL